MGIRERKKIKKEIEFLEIKGYIISDSFVSFYKEYGELYIDKSGRKSTEI